MCSLFCTSLRRPSEHGQRSDQNDTLLGGPVLAARWIRVSQSVYLVVVLVRPVPMRKTQLFVLASQHHPESWLGVHTTSSRTKTARVRRPGHGSVVPRFSRWNRTRFETDTITAVVKGDWLTWQWPSSPTTTVSRWLFSRLVTPILRYYRSSRIAKI